MEAFESEDVKIDGWEIRLPSDICTNRQIFDEIFSIDTWNNVLTPEQRCRLTQMLPKEIAASPEMSKQTIEGFFNGSLTMFSEAPLDNFYGKLESGQFDPVVTEMKANIKRELRKESIRQLKNYHTSLLEDIVVSRQRYMNRLKARIIPLTNKSKPTKAKQPLKPKKQTGAGVLQNASSELNTKLSTPIVGAGTGKQPKMPQTPVKPVTKVEPPDASLNPLNVKKRKNTEDPLDLADSGKPLYKKNSNIASKPKPSLSKGKTGPTTTCSGNKIGGQSANDQVENKPAPPPPTSPTTIVVKVENCSPSISDIKLQQQQQQQQDQPVIIVTASQTPTRFMPASHSSTSSPASSTTKSILNAALTSDKLVKSSTNSSSSIYTSSTKSSPILASQLQASPQVSVKMEDSLNFFSTESENDSGCITLNYQKLEEKSSEDDELESSSDEFEAIQPTIGFGSTTALPPTSTITTAMLMSSTTTPTLAKVMLSSPATGINTTFPSSSILPTLTTAATTTAMTTALTNKIIQVQPQHHQQDASGNSFVTVTVSSAGSGGGNKLQSHSSPVYILSTKTLTDGHQSHGRIIQIPKDAIKSIPISSQQLALMNSPKIIVKGTSSSSPPSSSSSSGLDQQQQQFIHQSSIISNQPQEIIRISNADLLNAKTSGNSVHYVTNSGKNLILHPVTSSGLNQPSSVKIISSSSGNQLISSCSNHPLTTSSYANLNIVTASSDLGGGGVQFATNASQPLKLNDLSLNSSSLLETGELNLSLSSLGSSLGGLGGSMTGMNVSNISAGSLDGGIMDTENMKLEIDKIDDLSVLDGTFDSIPNLSDELDGLDLDLVEGLCDFEGLLSDEKRYPSFFSLIREVLCSTRDHRMTLLCLEKTIRKWAVSPGAALNDWFLNVSDWNNGLVTALNFLAGTYQDVHPEDFVPYIEYKYKTKYYQWIGAGRDGDNNLTPLCGIWMSNLERLPSVTSKMDGETEDQEEEDEENEDSELAEDAKKKNKRPITPPPPRCVTDWTVRPSTDEEKNLFRVQERSRFDNPHKAFTYTMHCYESVVGPVKGVYSSQVGMTNKARGHSLLVDSIPIGPRVLSESWAVAGGVYPYDRPPYVTILALVRDAVARLPNGEGTRSEICEMLRDSAFLAPDASSVTLNSVVSGALDRLHYERDPCVRYDSHKKSWIYLHRDRTQDQFERLHHNRSYTKSTKSRNNTSRKSRRSTKAPTPTSASSSTVTPASAVSSTCSTPVTSTSPSSTTADSCTTGMDDLSVPTPTAAEPIKLITTTIPLPPQQVQSQSTTSESATLVSVENSAPRSENQTKSDVPNTSNTMLQTIKLTTLPVKQTTASSSSAESSTSMSIKVDATPVPVPVPTPTPVIPQQQQQPTQFLVQTTSSSMSPVTQNTIQLQSGRTVQIQGFPSIATTSTGETVMVSGIQTGTTSSATPQGQMLFGPQTVLRIANALRLSQMRLPGSTMAPGNIRVPQQHRILLTRGAVPGQPGILLGHTSSGQTVILSTTGGNIGSLQTLSTSSNQILSQIQQQQETIGTISTGSNNGVEIVSTPLSSSSSPTMTTYSLRQMLGKSLSQASPILSTNQPLTTQNISTSSSGGPLNSTPKMLQLNIAGGSGLMKSAIMTSASTSTQPVSTVVNAPSSTTTTAIGSGDFVVTSSGQTLAGVHPQRHPVGYTIATVRGNPMSLQLGTGSQAATINRTIGGQTIQLQALGQNQMMQSILAQNQTAGSVSAPSNNGDTASESNPMALAPNTTPIIIRSMQGDIMLPGHIALGKGGIKLFPFPVGNKTMLAKIIPPTSAASTTTSAPSPPTQPRLPITMSTTKTLATTTTTDIPVITTSTTTSFNANVPTTKPASPSQTSQQQ
ncbi:nuclear factor related to kappa-B-binding protein isoform X2 [Folsomia candida]|uniref:Nuclear factor related to kappa-B-binding protein n=1 Tax=Folsomia candida TaxID=158441 RepID=A0A226ER13_FOLCA|nr:nuclear factor related to kappa-B-binding protein isoform X2 [Folsomia candida]OXA60062.1 Nuclear factor related to kappa-B-binding protein [Folsomia candida]